MSKTHSMLFSGTFGDKISKYTLVKKSKHTPPKESDIIAGRVKNLDLREHPLKYKQVSSKKLSMMRQKIKERKLSREEYKIYTSNQRLLKRRRTGALEFWNQEKARIQNGSPTTRPWTAQQMHDIIHNIRPTKNGQVFQAHHTYSVAKYPHLANKGEVIYPVTFWEHLFIWHGGNFQKSLPGKPIRQIRK